MPKNLESIPRPDSLLSFQLNAFSTADWSDATELTQANLLSIKENLIRQRGSSGLWFYPAVVSITCCFMVNWPSYMHPGSHDSLPGLTFFDQKSSKRFVNCLN